MASVLLGIVADERSARICRRHLAIQETRPPAPRPPITAPVAVQQTRAERP